MVYQQLRDTLNSYYRTEAIPRTQAFQKRVYAEMDDFDAAHPGLDVYALKSALYERIAADAEPVLLDGMPFFGEMGTLHPFGDGEYSRGCLHANGWLFQRNRHIFEENDPDAWRIFCRNGAEKLFLTCGPYVDTEHFGIPMEKMFTVGLRGVYAECETALEKCESDEERAFVICAMTGLRALRTMQEKFASAAHQKFTETGDAMFSRMADAAERVPWEAPASVYEGLCLFVFARKAIGSLEGVGFNTFGRFDKLLTTLYEHDRENGVSEEEIYDDICRFMLLWDCHVDKSVIMTNYADYEYENTLVLGGCDADGNEVFSPITRMAIESQTELDCIYPKIMCRYSAASSEEYLTLITKPLLDGKSIVLYQNDDITIPALVKKGFAPADAGDYLTSGCWDIALPELTKTAGGEYVNILKALEWTIHQPAETMDANGIRFPSIDDAADFEAVYRTVTDNIIALIEHKAKLNAVGGRLWSKCNPVCVFSSLTRNCLKNRRDYTAGGTEYPWEVFCLSGFVDVIDSLLAIRSACFDKHLCTLRELLEACRNNWTDENLRRNILRSPHMGDGDEASAALANRMLCEIHERTRTLPTAFGGEYSMASYMYTEIIWWGKAIAATPNGRHDGEYIAHGLTPSRLHEISSVTDMVAAVAGMDMANFAGNTIINVVLPSGKITAPVLTAFLRACGKAGVQALQVNVVSREELLAAQKDPENYRHIIVRVCGFSAAFVSLSPQWQEEFLTRNFYEE